MFQEIHFQGRKLTFRRISTGEFVIGSINGLPIETPIQKITIKNTFYVMVTPVTQWLWVSVMKYNPSAFQGDDDLPLENVTWDEANEFCLRLSKLIEKKIRLLSEAEWEYVCRAGTKSEYFFGNEWNLLNEYAWFDLNSMDKTHLVAKKRPNPWGLYDIVGNVWEWCSDVWHSDYQYLTSCPMTSAQSRRVLRGGAWNMDYFRCRSAYRSYESKDFSTSKIGFRVAYDDI